MHTRRVTTLALVLTTACTGIIGGGNERTGRENGTDLDSVNPDVVGVGKIGLRRLTRAEYASTVRDVLGVEAPEALTYLPDEIAKPFDNDFTTQVPSQALVQGVELLASTVTKRVIAAPAVRDRVVGCAPKGADDAVCMRTFVTTTGRRLFRRPLAEDEAREYLAFQTYSTEASDFYAGVGVALRAMLQDPSFLYRVEIGKPVAERPGLFRLDSWEIATRLSYFLWGTAPNDALLDRAAAKELLTPAHVRAAAVTMLEDPRGKDRVQRFHRAWLNTDQPQADSPELVQAMRAETSALVDRVVFEKKTSWLELFRSQETFVNDALATNYGLPPPGSSDGRWIPYGAAERRGILSHGSFLANGAKFGDTSPTRRGKIVRNRLLCQELAPPPPNVNVDEPPNPSSGACKVDRYHTVTAAPDCASCHKQMDPIGFGLEGYDTQGRRRTTEKDHPECTIAGEGEIVGVGKFRGPAELGDLLARSGTVEACLVKQLYRFAWGHTEGPDDLPYLEDLSKKFHDKNQAFGELLLDLVSAEAFGYRREE